jgi:hypothetical protein
MLALSELFLKRVCVVIKKAFVLNRLAWGLQSRLGFYLVLRIHRQCLLPFDLYNFRLCSKTFLSLWQQGTSTRLLSVTAERVCVAAGVFFLLELLGVESRVLAGLDAGNLTHDALPYNLENFGLVQSPFFQFCRSLL